MTVKLVGELDIELEGIEGANLKEFAEKLANQLFRKKRHCLQGLKAFDDETNTQVRVLDFKVTRLTFEPDCTTARD